MGFFARLKKKESDVKTAVLTEPAVTPAVPATEHTHRAATSAWRVLAYPLVSEKAAGIGAFGQYVFVVRPTVTKIDVAQAIREVYGVKPVRVNMSRVRGKSVRHGRSFGRTKSWKKAIVTLPKGKKIKVYEGV